MKEPLRWVDSRTNSAHARLLRSVVDEPLPNDAMLRAAKRLGVAAALLNASTVSAASAATAQALAAGTKVAASSSSAMLMTLAKAIVIGLGAGSLMIGAAKLTVGQHSAGTSSPSRPTAQVALPVAARNVKPAGPIDESLSEVTSTQVSPPAPFVRDEPSQPGSARKNGLSASTSRPTQAASTGAINSPTSAPDKPLALARFSDEADPQVNVASKPAPPLPEATTLPSNAPTSSLAGEVRVLDAARQALRSGDAQRALGVLNLAKQQRTFLALTREAAVLRVEALGAVGQTQQAESLARRLLTEDVTPTQRKSLERWIGPSK